MLERHSPARFAERQPDGSEIIEDWTGDLAQSEGHGLRLRVLRHHQFRVRAGVSQVRP